MSKKFSEELPERGQLIRVLFPDSSEVVTEYHIDENGDGIVLAIGIFKKVSELTTWEPVPACEHLSIIIRNNRGCRAIIDNDSWNIYQPLPKGIENWDEDRKDKWYENDKPIASSRQFPELDNCYGGGILEALAYIVGVSVEYA